MKIKVACEFWTREIQPSMPAHYVQLSNYSTIQLTQNLLETERGIFQNSLRVLYRPELYSLRLYFRGLIVFIASVHPTGCASLKSTVVQVVTTVNR